MRLRPDFFLTLCSLQDNPMTSSIKVPALGESITEAIVASWLKQVGEPVAIDEAIVELETDKITVEVPSPAAGVLTKQMAEEGATVNVGDMIAELSEGDAAQAQQSSDSPPAATPVDASPSVTKETPATQAPAQNDPQVAAGTAMPAARAEAGRQGVDIQDMTGSGRGGRVLKEDLLNKTGSAAKSPAAPAPLKKAPAPAPRASATPATASTGVREERVKMTPMRKRIAANLLTAQQSAAILTTFNECDMSAVMNLRKEYKLDFQEKHGVKLGFMSFFVKAVCHALKAFPAVNAEIDGDDILYKHHYDIGVAVGGGKGLVVPVVRDADLLNFSQVESEILRLAGLAKTNKLQLSDLTGGTFTISNGGIYGSMLSTPILNPPQTGILGLHNIIERPMAIDGKVEIRPMMYLALSYDHRLVDGREAVQFLLSIKGSIEDPRRLLLDL